MSVGIFLKRAGRVAQLRPMQKWVALSFSLPYRVDHPRISRKVVLYHGRYYHVFNIRDPGEIDDDIRNWLTEAYLSAPE